MSLSNVLVPNNFNLYEGTKFVPTFTKNVADTNTYTDLGSMYIRSNDGNQINVISKIRIVSANPGVVMNVAMSLPVAASAPLTAGAAIVPQTPVVLSSTGAPVANVFVINSPVASNTASAVQLASAVAIPTSTTNYVTLNFSYNLNPANN